MCYRHYNEAKERCPIGWGEGGMLVRKVFPSLITLIFPGAPSGGSKPEEGACHLRNLPSCN